MEGMGYSTTKGTRSPLQPPPPINGYRLTYWYSLAIIATITPISSEEKPIDSPFC